MRKCLRAHLNGILEDIIDVYGDWKPILQYVAVIWWGLITVNNIKLILLYEFFLVPLHHK